MRILFSVQIAVEEPVACSQPTRISPIILVGVGALGLGILDGYVGYALVSPGESLIETCAIVGVIALTCLGLGWIVLRRKKLYAPFRLFALIIVVFGAAAVWWTWAFAMPAAMMWDTQATPTAIASLTGIGTEKSVCTNVATGSVGPLDAPYQRCAINGPPGATVYYHAMTGSRLADPYRGLIFSYAPTRSFSDECVRHLVGHWYAYTGDPVAWPATAAIQGLDRSPPSLRSGAVSTARLTKREDSVASLNSLLCGPG